MQDMTDEFNKQQVVDNIAAFTRVGLGDGAAAYISMQLGCDEKEEASKGAGNVMK